MTEIGAWAEMKCDKFESDRAKTEEVIAKKRGLTGSEIHSSVGLWRQRLGHARGGVAAGAEA